MPTKKIINKSWLVNDPTSITKKTYIIVDTKIKDTNTEDTKTEKLNPKYQYLHN